MTPIDVSVPLELALRNCPGNTPFSLEAITRIARGDSSNLSTLHVSAHGGTHVDAPRHFIEGPSLCDVEPGEYDMYGLPLRLVGSDGAPARVVLHRS